MSPYLGLMTVSVSPPPILETAGVDPDEALSVLSGALAGADDGELFLEKTESESLVFDDGRLKSAAYDAVVSSGDVTLDLMVARGPRPVFHLGPARDHSLFDDAAARLGAPVARMDVASADYVVCTGLFNDDERPLAIATDTPLATSLPRLDINDPAQVADFIVAHLGR